ncbi:hypothetical protein TTHERM_00474910 (macronuclear) [Tetrahymena thermophila SB210]|uniref:Kinase domain protein n=1 Tax=Tetrahymena thermophila (strain SB210) TaxID=312017 RepID=I7MM04_TETTS|nr:hypothetical protein TTHERM_00474910 [Tetrahymena thermophila SB210]EAS03728.2 hypothetical protein TTHERM_00474910 [Tetrahymena thermophila SB210]|eukprot:XP_001023973.2 hypothetical protein TTHERM_00474910 [Tetrahymena thermophila SB210]
MSIEIIDAKRAAQRKRQIGQLLKQIHKSYTENRSLKEEFNVILEPYIRQNDEASCAVVERRELREDEDECIAKLKKDDVAAILDIIKKLNPQLEEQNLPLKKLSLKSCTLPLSGESIEQLAQFISSIPSLDSFTLRFIWCGVKMPPRFIFCITKMAPQLRELYLHFALKPDLAEQCISNLAKAIDSCRFLESLNIDGMECEGITNNCLSKLGKMTNKLESLRTFVFKLRSSQYIDEKGIQDFGTEFTKTKQLTHLELSFYYFINTFSKQSMISLGKAICQQTELQSLVLDFSWCSDIVDEAAQIIISQIMDINDLRSLNINFSGSTRITDLTLQYIGQALKSNDQISKLFLYFGNCESFTDQGLFTLSKYLAKCTNLQELTLDFSSCFSITESGLESICSVIHSLYLLEDLFISTHDFLSNEIQDLINQMQEKLRESALRRKSINLSLFVTNQYSTLLKRKDVLNDLAY